METTMETAKVEWRDNSAHAYCRDYCGWEPPDEARGLDAHREAARQHADATGHRTTVESTAAWIDTYKTD